MSINAMTFTPLIFIWLSLGECGGERPAAGSIWRFYIAADFNCQNGALGCGRSDNGAAPE